MQPPRRRDAEKNAEKKYHFPLSFCSRRLGALYVQIIIYPFYFSSSRSRDDERSEESCERDDRLTTDCASAFIGRRRAGYRPVSRRFVRTAA